jgi:glycosyltransferase involved in cell wall biosynthesis
MISAVVLSKNEEKNLPDCLKSLLWCDEIIVVDDYSDDKTREIARQYKAKVFLRSLKNNFAVQRNYGLNKARGKWVLFVDADEQISPELAQEIKAAIQKKYQGFFLKRQDFFFNQPLKFGETARTRLLRLAQKGSGCWQRPVHESWQVQGRVGQLKNPLFHYSHPSLDEFLIKINYFSSLHAQALKKEGRKSGFFPIIFKPLAKFIINYFWYQSFKDGVPGLIMALMMSLHSFLAWGKLYLNEKNN